MVKDIRIRTTFIDENKTLRITIRGDLTGTTGPKLLEALAGHQKKKPGHIELGFDEKCYINSGGIAYLIDLASSAKENKQTISANGLSDHFRKIFTMVGLTRCMELGD